MARRRKVGNLLGLGLLSLLVTGETMHPYEMANFLRRTGKERDFRIKWGSLYTVVQNLEKHGFIVATGSDRSGGRPERTAYAITDAGREEFKDWLRELLGEPETERSSFEAALSVVGPLPPDEVVELLTQRLRGLEVDAQIRRAQLAEHVAHVPRIFLIESEFAVAMVEAEAAWVRGLLAEIANGTLAGVTEWRLAHETGEMPAEWTRMLAEERGRPTDG